MADTPAAPGSLHSTVRRAGAWVAIRQIAVRALTILQLLLLARILAPADFGVFAVAMIVYTFIEAITFLGFGHALIQKPVVSDRDLNTLFVVNIARGVLLGGAVAAVSGPMAWLMNAPGSASMVAVMGLMPFIIGLQNPAMILLQKDLRNRQELGFYLAGAGANLVVSIGLALAGFGGWALVFGMLAQAGGQLVVSYIIQPFRPRIEFDRASFSDMFHFGKWLLAAQGLKYFSNNLPSWVIGHYLGVQSLGVYHVSARFSQAVGTEFAALTSTIAFPAFSKLQSDVGRLSAAYMRSQKVILSASFALFGCMVALAKPFVTVFLGAKWAGAETIIALLSIMGAVQSIGAQAEVARAINVPGIIARYSLYRLLLVLALIFYMTPRWGTEGSVMAILIPTILTLPFAMATILGRLSISAWAYIRIALAPTIALAALCLLPLLPVTIANLFTFVLASAVALLVYASVLASVDLLLRTGIVTEWRLIVGGLLAGRFRRG